MMIFSEDSSKLSPLLDLMNSSLSCHLMSCLTQTLNFDQGIISRIPIIDCPTSDGLSGLIKNSKHDWDLYERSWDFLESPLLNKQSKYLVVSYGHLRTYFQSMIDDIKGLEEKNNQIFIEAYGLKGELTPEVSLKEITLTCNPHSRYGGNKSDEELEELLRTDTMKELISYAIGCMMGRYSLDAPGLIMASQGETLDDYVEAVKSKYDVESQKYEEVQHAGPLYFLSRLSSFAPDDDGIVPILEDTYFSDDCYHRLVEFLTVTFSEDTLDENLQFLASHFKPKKNETPETTLRRYLSNQFFKDHLKTYKKRPIYWQVSSGKEKAFQCLVYMHRYTPATLSRMRTTYVRKLQGDLLIAKDNAEKDLEIASSTSEKTDHGKRITKLDKQIEELRKFDEKLRHLADKQIDIDLDDGVKHNYGLFGDLLAEVKAVTGKAPVKV